MYPRLQPHLISVNNFNESGTTIISVFTIKKLSPICQSLTAIKRQSQDLNTGSSIPKSMILTTSLQKSWPEINTSRQNVDIEATSSNWQDQVWTYNTTAFQATEWALGLLPDFKQSHPPQCSQYSALQASTFILAYFLTKKVPSPHCLWFSMYFLGLTSRTAPRWSLLWPPPQAFTPPTGVREVLLLCAPGAASAYVYHTCIILPLTHCVPLPSS